MIFSMRLGAEQGRVIGSLIEKQLTTPQQYPLSLNALVQACNQLSNRDPVVSYDERLVDETLVSLKEAGLVRFVHPSHGRSVTRYRQVLDERLGLDEQQLALVAVLLLRGAQTAGELRTRTERMASFEGISALESRLARLADGPEPLVARLGRRPGQKEERWTQLLMEQTLSERADSAGAATDGTGWAGWAVGAGVAESGSSQGAPVGPPGAAPGGQAPAFSTVPPGVSPGPAPTGPLPSPAGQPSAAAEVALLETEVVTLKEEVVELRSEVADLRGEVIDLRAALEHLEAQLGGI
jgi:uncharacterized protein YceH (UPF0502 family)